MGRVKINLHFWNNCKFWNIPKPNYSRIIPGIIPEIWNVLNYSKIFELFQTSIFRGFRAVRIIPRIIPHAYAQARARNYMEKYIPIGDIYFSNVISLEGFKLFQIPAKNYDASPLSPSGRLAVILPQKGGA